MNKLRITNDYIASLNPCNDRHDNYLKNYSNTDFSIAEFLKLDKISYADKIWVWKKIATINEAALFGFKCASSVLVFFETKHPNDDRPRKALESVEAYLKCPTENNKQKCMYAAAAASTAAYDVSAYASYVAAANDYSTSAYAAPTAANVAAAVAYAAASTAASTAAFTAANAASTAAVAASYAATHTQQKELNLSFLIEVYSKDIK